MADEKRAFDDMLAEIAEDDSSEDERQQSSYNRKKFSSATNDSKSLGAGEKNISRKGTIYIQLLYMNWVYLFLLLFVLVETSFLADAKNSSYGNEQSSKRRPPSGNNNNNTVLYCFYIDNDNALIS